jgi:nucleoside-diphosphate-sugar epimerase
MSALPEKFLSAEHLDDVMSEPSPALIADLAEIPGDIIVIGVAGKMGPTVARMAKRACPDRRVIGAARFSDPAIKSYLESHGVETISVDLLDRSAVATLPVVPNVIFMAGHKFGSSGNAPLTWAMNGHVPSLIAEHYKNSRIVAYSTICVYPFADVTSGGPREDDEIGPPGEYAMSCVARERMFQYFSARHKTPGAIIRLSYAIDMRYGVLHDLGQKVMHGEEIDLSMGHVNLIWQGDACSQSLRVLRHCTVPSLPINVSGPETASIRALAKVFGRLFKRDPVFRGQESPTAWIANTGRAAELFGYPSAPLDRLVGLTAHWLTDALGTLGKPTHFEARSGHF